MLFGIGKIPPHSMTPLTRELRKRLTAASLSAGLLASTFGGPVAAESQGQDATLLAQVPQSQRVDPSTSLQLKVRRLPDAIELIIEGTGPGPQLQQGGSGSGWQGQLFTAASAALRVGPQRLSLPEVGLQSISFDGGGQSFSLAVTPAPGINLGRPVVSADGRDLILTFASPVPQASLQVNRLNMAQPGAVPLPTYAPPLQPRAVAPPLGDMAVGTMTLRNPGYVNLPGPPVTMTMKNAPAKDALMALAQLGGYGFAYVSDTTSTATPEEGLRTISLAFRGENFGRAFNTALLAAGLQGKREGNMILAGPTALSKSFGPQVSKIYRLNQVGPNAAADYLANLGASVTKTNTITTSVTQGAALAETVAGGAASQTTQSSSITNVEAYGASTGPLLGLRATTDTRLGTITMVGDPSIVSIAEQYLKKLDLRQRQVALNVRILDVNLDNETEIDNSFAFRWGNNFIVNDSGQLLGAFGRDLPPDANAFRRDVPREIEFDGEKFTVEGGGGGLGLSAEGSSSSFVIETQRGRALDSRTIRGITRETGATLSPVINPRNGRISYVATPQPGTEARSFSRTVNRLLGNQATIARADSQTNSDVGGVARNPGRRYASDTFFDFVRAQIISGSTKLLASPTLILQENPSLLREGSERGGGGSSQQGSQGITDIGLDSAIGRRRANEGVVRVGTNVVTGYETETPAQGGNVVCTPDLSTAGLVLGARVEKIDDNGFVTFVLSPSVSAVTSRERAPQGCGSDLNILSIRSLDTGALRVRDGQTLIMTGVISEFDRQEVSKWPILGDIPLIGQFFRATSGRKEKRELVIMVTPRIVNDEQGGVYGYGYQPGTSAGREFFGSAIQGGGFN
ncbi:MAG: type II secretion system protein GspD [Cyanobacteriota bacterium]